MKRLCEGCISDSDFHNIKNIFKKLGEALSNGSPVRAVDVIEGAAVFNSYRMCSYSPTHEGFLCHLESYYKKPSIYSRAYQYATDLIGEKIFDLFSPICYMALQTPNPGRYFIEILSEVKDKKYLLKPSHVSSDSEMRESPLFYLFEKNTFEYRRFLPYVMHNKFMEHPILTPYIKLITEICKITNTPVFWIEDFIARPYCYLPGYTLLPHLFKRLPKEFWMPGAIGPSSASFIFLNDFNTFRIVAPVRAHLNPEEVETLRWGTIKYNRSVSLIKAGLGIELDDTYVMLIIAATAIIGIIRVFFLNEKGIMYCPHKNCEVYKTKLCAWFYDFPQDNFYECGFFQIWKLYNLENYIKNR